MTDGGNESDSISDSSSPDSSSSEEERPGSVCSIFWKVNIVVLSVEELLRFLFLSSLAANMLLLVFFDTSSDADAGLCLSRKDEHDFNLLIVHPSVFFLSDYDLCIWRNLIIPKKRI